MKCVNHLEQDAVAVCNSCGKSICSDCSAQENNEYYCKDCIVSKKAFGSKHDHSPGLALFLSFMVPGLGQCYNGQFGKGILILLTSWLFIPWIIGIVDAYAQAKKIREGGIALKSRTGCMIAFVAGTLAMSLIILLMAVAAIIFGVMLSTKEQKKNNAAKASVVKQEQVVAPAALQTNQPVEVK